MEENKEVYLITTDGCESCKIMERIIRKVIKDVPNIKIKVVDKDKVDAWITANVIFRDFPTVVIVRNNMIKYHFSGTRTRDEFVKLLNICY